MHQSVFDPSLQNVDTPAKIVTGIERLAEAIRVLLWDQAKETGLSPIQIQILLFVAYHTQRLTTVSHLAREFNMSKPTISDAVKSLYSKKLIKKDRYKDDLRTYSISLSKAGEKVIEKTQDLGHPLRSIAATLPKSDQDKFVELLSKMIYGLHNMDILAVQRMCFSCQFFDDKGKKTYCRLLGKELRPVDVRIDCPEFEPLP